MKTASPVFDQDRKNDAAFDAQCRLAKLLPLKSVRLSTAG